MGHTTVQLEWGVVRVRADEVVLRRSPLNVLGENYHYVEAADTSGWHRVKNVGSAVGLTWAMGWILEVRRGTGGASLTDIAHGAVGLSPSPLALLTLLVCAVVLGTTLQRPLVDVSVPLSNIDAVEVDEEACELRLLGDDCRFPLGSGEGRPLRPVSEAGLADVRAALRMRGVEVAPVTE